MYCNYNNIKIKMMHIKLIKSKTKMDFKTKISLVIART